MTGMTKQDEQTLTQAVILHLRRERGLGTNKPGLGEIARTVDVVLDVFPSFAKDVHVQNRIILVVARYYQIIPNDTTTNTEA